MRVLWFTNTSSCYQQGGGSKGYNGGGWIASLEEELKKCKDVELGICFYVNNVVTPKKEIQNGTVYYILPRPHKTISYTLKTVFNGPEKASLDHERIAMPILQKVVEDFAPDVIQVFGSENIYGLIAAYVSVPVVLHIQGILSPYLNAFLPPFISWRMYLWQDKSFKAMLGRISNRIAWRRNSITEKRMVGAVRYFMGRTVWDERIVKLLNPEAHYFHCDEILRNVFYLPVHEHRLPDIPTFVTTISSQLYKGYDMVLKTALILKQRLNCFEWKVFGDVSPTLIEKEFHIRHESVNVKLMGVASAEDIREALLHATAYIHTSYIDNSPNSLCEASLLGVSSISTMVGGVSSLIEDGRTGFLVPANDPYQMAFLMNYMVEHPEINLEVGKKARQVAMKRHDRQAIAEKVVGIYKSLIKEG